jgi:hypothetical protein
MEKPLGNFWVGGKGYFRSQTVNGTQLLMKMKEDVLPFESTLQYYFGMIR